MSVYLRVTYANGDTYTVDGYGMRTNGVEIVKRGGWIRVYDQGRVIKNINLRHVAEYEGHSHGVTIR